MTGSDDPPGRVNASILAQDFFRETAWHPTLIGTAAGAPSYSEHGPGLKQGVRLIARVKHAPTVTSHDTS